MGDYTLKKYFWSLFFLTHNTFAIEAIVISFKAPLVLTPDYKGHVSQVLSKGEKIFLGNEYNTQDELPEFVETFDRLGQTVYIPSRMIKIIYRDERETKDSIVYIDPKTGYDSTDYRIEEPIPHSYPFENREFSRLNVSLELGSNPKDPYDYNANISKQEFDYSKGIRFIYQRKMDFDLIDRLYFGAYVSFSSVNNQILFSSEAIAEENRSQARLGPIISYDFFKNEDYILNLGTGFTWNYHRSSIEIDVPNIGSEENLYSGFSVAPFITSQFFFRDVFPNADFTLGSEISAYLPHSQKASGTQILATDYWSANNPNTLSQNLRLQAQFHLGFNFKY